MTQNQRRKTLDLAAAALALALLLPYSAAAQRHRFLGTPVASQPKTAVVKPAPTGPCANPSQCIAVDFDKAPLSEVVYLVSEITGDGFVFDDNAKTPSVSWSQQNVQKSQLLPTFIKVLTSLGLTVHRIEDSNFFAIRPDPALVSGADQLSSGVYHLKYLDADAVQKSADTIYGKRLSSFGAKGSKVIAFSGDPGLVADFSRTLADIDQPPQTDSGIASIKLRHISVRTAVAALNDLRIFASSKSGSSSSKGEKSSSNSQSSSGGIFPDYWNRSVIIHGSKQQQDMALLALSAIDKPQEGHADEVAFLSVLTADDALAALKELYEALSVRKLSDDRLLISGDRPVVDKALSTVSKMDGAGLQVKVEAVFASLTDKEFLELGSSLSSTRSDFNSSLNSSFVKVFPVPYSGALLNYFDEVLSVKFAAGEGFSKGEVISSPTLTVLNGKEAQLVVGQNVPFLTQKDKKSKKDEDGDDEESTGLSVERKDVGLSFKIKPVIRPDGDFISLTVFQELSSVNPESQLKNAVDLIVDKKSVATTVLVGNGDLIFLGGLRYQEAGKSVDQVPLLGDIPLLGQLFTYRSEVVHARNLIISLRVNVISAPEQDVQDITFSAQKG
jgi:type II secretory pathway component GspD/PulD (secretin)